MTWVVQHRLNVLGAPIMVVSNGEIAASIGVFDYPTGRRKVRCEFMDADHVNSDPRPQTMRIFGIAAAASRLTDSVAKLGKQTGLEYQSCALERSQTQSVLVDTEGRDALRLVLPYFGEAIVEAWADVLNA